MSWLLILTFILSPAYAWRFKLAGLPANFLLLWSAVIILIGLIVLYRQKLWQNFYAFWQQQNKTLLVWLGLFFLAGVISLFVGGFDEKKLGQFLVWFAEPLAIFLLGKFWWYREPTKKELFFQICYWLLGLAALYAIIQYFTLWGLPLLFRGNDVEVKRAVSVFAHPNFYALFITPLLALLLPHLWSNLKTKRFWLYAGLWLVGSVGLLLTLSRAGWLGLAVAVIIFLYNANRRTRELLTPIALIGIVIILLVPSFRHRLTSPLHTERSAGSRVTLWEDGVTGIKKNPLLGLGLTGFSQHYNQLNTDQTLDTHNFPHNIFLNFWVETGLLGLLSFITIVIFGIQTGWKNKNNIYAFGVSLFLVAILVQGQFDNPYFKNDLAMVFWLVMALI